MNGSKLSNWLLMTTLAVGISLLTCSAVMAGVFSTIDFEQSEGNVAPQDRVWGTAQQNIGDGPDLKDIHYGSGNPTAMFTWTGTSTGYGGGWPPIGDGIYGVPSGQSAFYCYGNWNWSYARTPVTGRPVPAQMQDDRYFTVEYNSLVVFALPDIGNNCIPPEIQFWINGRDSNNVGIYHSKSGEDSSTYDIWLNVNGATYKVGNYVFQQWADEKLVFDKTANLVSFYYNGELRGVYPFSPIAKWETYGVSYYYGTRDGTLATDNIRFGTENPDIFNTIDFEESEGYAAPQDRVWGTAQQNIGVGPDLVDVYYGNGNPTAMFAWTGVSTGYTGGWPPIADGNYGVPSGKSAFYYYGCWSWDYARTIMTGRPVSTDRQKDRYFTIDYNSLVVFSAPDEGNNLIPATMQFWFNGFEQNGVTIMHSKAGIGSSTYDIWLNVNGAEHMVGNYVYGQWAVEKLVFDRVLGNVTYYYNGTALGTYTFPTLASWQTYGVNYCFGNRDGVLATDNLRFGTVVDTSILPKVSYSDDVTVDGDLNDWATATWIPMATIYDPVAFVSEGGDINSAAYAVKWGAGGTRVYVAVKVDDEQHGLTNNYTDWFSRDAVELYLHTLGSGGNYGQYQEPAQQWAMGIKNSDRNAVWATLGYPKLYDYPAPYSRGDYTPTASEFVGAGREVGTWLYYEAAMTPYQYFASRWNLDNPSNLKNSTTSPLTVGQVVNFGVVAASNDGTNSYMFDPNFPGYRGMASDNENAGWSANYSNVPRRVLVRNGVKGKITLTGYSGSTLRAAATVKVYSGATLLQTKNLVLDGIGNYSFENILNGTYTLTASAAGYLPQSKSVTIASGEGSADFTLVKPTSIALTDAKKQATDTAIGVSGAITAMFTDYFYIESADRVTGIRVNKTAHGFTTSDLGKVVNVAGLLKRDPSTQECYIDVLSIEMTAGTATILPLALNNKAAVGGDYVDSGTGNGQVGASDGKGLNNVGLLVRTTGRASAGDANGFTLTDGSGVTVYVALAGAGTTYNGKYVIVTGISSLYPSKVRAIRVFRSSDVQQAP